MIATWMAWAVVIGAGVGAGTALLEWALLAYRRPVRWIWMGALLGTAILTLVVPRASPLRPSPVHGPSLSAVAGEASRRDIRAVLRGALAAPARWASFARARVAPLDTPLLVAWGALSVLFGALLLQAQLRLRRDRTTWPLVRIDGTLVRVSPDLGPAVVGWRRPEIVVPRWALAMPDDDRRLILLHEREHLEARDQHLLALAVLIVLVAPWNPALWWTLRRLRLAIEIDCDRRALRAGASLRAYGELLVQLGSRTRRSLVPVAALAERGAMLVRRVRAFTAAPPRARWARGGAAVAMALLFFGTAAASPSPDATFVGTIAEVSADSAVRVASDSAMRFVERPPVPDARSVLRRAGSSTRTPQERPDPASGSASSRSGVVIGMPARGGRLVSGDSARARASQSDTGRSAPPFRGRGGGRGGSIRTRPDTSRGTLIPAGAVIRARSIGAPVNSMTRRPPF